MFYKKNMIMFDIVMFDKDK